MKKPSAQRSTSAKKTATKKSAVKRAAVKKAATKQAPAKKAAVKKAAVKKAARSSGGPRRYAGLPVVWQVNSGKQTVGLWVDDHVWTGNDVGECYKLDKSTGKLVSSWKLPGECVAVVSDDAWRYAGCNDGCIYDLTGDVARVAYQLGGARHDWIEVNQGVLCVSDDRGTITVIDVDGTTRWQKSDPKATEAWVLRTAADGLYHGSMVGLRKYDWSGKRKWETKCGDVRYGAIDGDDIIVTSGFFTASGNTCISRIERAKGKELWRKEARTKSSGFYSSGAEACAASASSEGTRRFFAAVGGYVFCYDDKGKLQWEAPTKCESLCNMMVQGDALYFASANGAIGRADISPAAFAKLEAGAWPAPSTRSQGRLKERSRDVERTKDTSKGVVVECVKEGGKVRVRVISKGYRSDWFCQFPRDIREVGAKFVVDEVREATQGGFYRVLGNIKRLD
ncbi:MAG: PQQ-binding-like beta-propeller repeat protein [Myxococcales bacterium]|nr:PQQ-binding-like beta-propeller repeat protein [Myxococcales bacterium]